MEQTALRYQARDALLHRIFPFCLVAMLLVISALMAIFANAYVGGAAFATTLAGVVTVYLRGAMGGEKKATGREVADPSVPPRGS
jgi:energy-coupling factor transporter transmembrane protein EcfT